MAKYMKKPIVVEAHQWFKNGDHPDDNSKETTNFEGEQYLTEGEVVRYFRHPEISGDRICEHCGYTMHYHGWIDQGEAGITVCSGDWVLTKPNNKYGLIRDSVFKKEFQKLQEIETVEEPKLTRYDLTMAIIEYQPIKGLARISGFPVSILQCWKNGTLKPSKKELEEFQEKFQQGFDKGL